MVWKEESGYVRPIPLRLGITDGVHTEVISGDLKEGDGDPSLVFFGQAVSPNHHALALRFGLLDRFFTNSEVSSQGHIWSTAAYVTDYGEKVIPSGYAGKRGDVDGE